MDERTAFQSSKAAYSAHPPHDLPGGWELVQTTPTIKIYKNGNQIVCAVRGTADLRDVRADSAIPFNNLVNTDRYKEDLATMQRVVRRFPADRFVYHITGHSLGSAIGIQLKKAFPYFRDGTFFNGALMPSQLWNQDPSVREIFAARDPLFNVAGRFWRNKTVVNPSTPAVSDMLSRGAQAVQAHKLDTFKHLYSLVGGWLSRNKNEDEAIKALEDTPLTSDDLTKLLGPINILTYPQLRDAQRIEDVLDPLGRVAILFLTSGPQSGHWISVSVQGGGDSGEEPHLEYFDSYSGDVDEPFEWLSASTERKLKQTTHHLTRLLNEAKSRGIKVVCSGTQLQSDDPSVATCGKHMAIRMLMSHMSLPTYLAFIKGIPGVSPDAAVTIICDQLLHQ